MLEVKISEQAKRPAPRYAVMEFDLDAESSVTFDVVNGLLRLGSVLVIGIDIDGADDSRSVHDEASRHRQGPTALAIMRGKVDAEIEIDHLQVVG